MLIAVHAGLIELNDCEWLISDMPYYAQVGSMGSWVHVEGLVSCLAFV